MEQHKPDLHSVAVAVCTRDRPEMLRATLHSLAALELDGIDCCFIIIENNEIRTVTAVVGEFADMVGAERVTYCLETHLGIACARNAALKTALGMNVDALAFIDDDEIADPQWLAELLKVANRDRLDLVGGPVGLQPPPADASANEKMVWRGLSARCRAMERKSRSLARKGRDHRITIVTNNWLADLSFIRRTGLHFDEALGMSGGEDTAFFRELRHLGGKTGWATDALILETMPRERLTLAYQYRRASDQALVRQRAKYPRPGFVAVMVFLATALFKTAGGIFRIFQSFFDGGASLVRAARAFGAIAGAASALHGRSSNHYATVSGR